MTQYLSTSKHILCFISCIFILFLTSLVMQLVYFLLAQENTLWVPTGIKESISCSDGSRGAAR